MIGHTILPMAENELRALLDIPAILALAGQRSFERGVEYVAEHRVGEIDVSDDAIEAPVLGSDRYLTRVSVEEGRLVGDCSCPMGDMGAFCKHCVALALAWIEPAAGRIWGDRRTDLGRPRAPIVPPLPPEAWWEEPDDDTITASDDPIRAYLEALDHDELVDLIDAEMAHDDTLRTRIRLRAEAASTDGTQNLRRALDGATAVHGFLEYAEVPTWAAGVEDVADAIEAAIDQGHAEAVIDLAERGLQRVGTAIENSDDSDGYHGDFLRRFEGIHLAACRVAKPDPVELARRLFKQELESEWDVFAGAAERYADVLGEEGLAEYRRLAQEQWAAVPVRAPNADPDRLPPMPSHHAFTVTRMMESLARASGDLDELIAVMSRDLSSAYQYLQLAQVCRDAGRADEALDWAERGVGAFPGRTDSRLVEFLAEAYLERSRGDEAEALVWKAFTEEPDLESFQRLHRVAEHTGELEAWRSRALERVRAAYRHPEGVGTTLVAIHGWEGEFDAAWAAAHEFGCERHELSKLAKRTEGSHPEEASAVLKEEVAEVLSVADRRNYTMAIGLLRRIERISARLGRPDEFRVYVTEVRAQNARRPAFCSMFDATGMLPRE